MKKIILIGLVGILALALTSEVNAQGKKGPRASIRVATVCSLDGTDLTVELRIRDRTSGSAIPLVTAWNTDASFLERGVPGNQWQTFSSDGQSGLQLGVPVTVSSTFSLCAALGGIRTELEDARTLNGLAEVSYGKDDGAGGVKDIRTIKNRCSDDPMTTDVVEPAGIWLSPADIEAIDIACTP